MGEDLLKLEHKKISRGYRTLDVFEEMWSGDVDASHNGRSRLRKESVDDGVSRVRSESTRLFGFTPLP